MKKTSPIQAQFDQLSIPTKLLTAGSAACFADFATFPLDTAKVRLQIQGEAKVPAKIVSVASAPGVRAAAATAPVPPNVAVNMLFQRSPVPALHYRGIAGTISTIAKEEGFRSLYNGLNAGLQRQMCFASIRLGLYEPVKVYYQKLFKVKETGFMDVASRVAAGLSVGAVAVLVAQPTEIVKLRFQAQQKGSSLHQYKSTWNAYTQIFRKDGVTGLWKGTMPNAGRNAIVNVSEIVCYDLVKESIIKRNLMTDNIPCHFVSAVVAGFCATVCASPVDVVKTRYINSNGNYSGAMDCAVKTFMREGAPAFYKGFWVSFSRLVSWNIVMWISYEQLKGVVVQKTRKD